MLGMPINYKLCLALELDTHQKYQVYWPTGVSVLGSTLPISASGTD
jgi:hypothetical protein